MTRTLARLAFGGIRGRLLASALTVALAAAPVATLLIALDLRAAALDPWQQTFDAGHGAHVVAMSDTEADVRAVADRPGVAERGDPVPSVFARLQLPQGLLELRVSGLDGQPRVDAPVPTAGSGPGDGTIVLERSFADTMDVPVGASVRVQGTRGPIDLVVAGTALQSSQGSFPDSQPGTAWTTRATLERIAPDQERWNWTQAIRLDDPSADVAFAEDALAALPPDARARCSPDSCAGGVILQTWQHMRESATSDTHATTVVLTAFAILLCIVTLAVVAILVSARASEQHRDLGLLKAAGLTPRQVGAIFALETGALALLGAAIGLAIGVLVAPHVAALTSESLLTAPSATTTPQHLLLAAGGVLVVFVAGAYLCARRSTRFSVLQAMRTGAVQPARSRVARSIAGTPLPLPLALGLRDLLARRQRALLLLAAIALAGAVVVAALAMKAQLDEDAATAAREAVERASMAGEGVYVAAADDGDTRLRAIVYVLDGVLLALTLTALVAVALLSVREHTRDHGVLKALGLTPAQLSSTLTSAHAALAAVAGLLAIPLGLGLYVLVRGSASGQWELDLAAPWWWFAPLPLGIALLAALVTSLPARRITRITVADALRYE
jgi:putative ABC transport system permease protein